MSWFGSATSEDTSTFRRRINRAPSPVLAHGMPWLTVMLASLLPSLFFIASAPVAPPFGFLVFLAWRQLRPGLLPVWAGLPLGVFDDLFSGQPFGSAILLWSATMILLDLVEARFPWRHFAIEWLMATFLVISYLLIGLSFANMAGGSSPAGVIAPQTVMSIMVYPLVGRMVAFFDRLRLFSIRDIS